MFYAELSEEKKIIEYKPLNNNKLILEEISNLLIEESPKDADCVSLYYKFNEKS